MLARWRKQQGRVLRTSDICGVLTNAEATARQYGNAGMALHVVLVQDVCTFVPKGYLLYTSVGFRRLAFWLAWRVLSASCVAMLDGCM